MRTTLADNLQWVLNAIELETDPSIHQHRNSSEIHIILRGRAEELFYDDQGNITERISMQPQSDCDSVNIKTGRCHRSVSLESDTVIFKAKDGAYEHVSPEYTLTI